MKMECSIIHCKQRANHTYLLGGKEGVKFRYCDSHRRFPDKLIKNKGKWNVNRWNKLNNESQEEKLF